MSGRNTQRDLEREPFLDMHAQIAKTPMLHDTDPTVLILDKPIFQNVPRTPEPAPVLPDLASNIRGPNRSGAGTLYTQNIFIASGMGLLLRLAPLRLMSEHPSPNDLQTELLTELKKLTVSLRENGCTEIAATAARYILCAALDEAVLSTSWGAKSVWSQRSLLATLHGETWGGEKLFAMLSDFQNDVDGNIDLIELIDTCLSLGFKGRYRLLEQGEAQLYDLRIALGRLVSTRRQSRPSSLAPSCLPETGEAQLRGWLPIWVAAVLSAVLIVSLYLYFFSQISEQNNVVIRTLRLIQATE
jgi:type VI secretion system protein ImpK